MIFNDFPLKKEILKAIKEWDFETPTEIQEKLIPILLEQKNDIIGLAQTGTGKTAAFGLPLVQHARKDSKIPRSLVLAPTRELCLQIAGDLRQYAKYLQGVNVIPVYGGAPIKTQIKDLEHGCQIIVATPGRLLDLIKRDRIDLEQIEYLVLDEADIMLSMGFKEELDAIFETIPRERTTLLFSATMPRGVARIAKEYMNSPDTVSAGNKNTGADSISHCFYIIHEKDRYHALKRLLDYNPEIYGIVFCRTKISTQEITDKLLKDGYNAQAIHSDLSQAQRDTVMSKFREGTFPILVATDVAARGIDVSELSHIIHYDLPDDSDSYIHRSGRTGRAGRTGASIALINTKQKYRIKMIEKSLGRQISQQEIPSGKQICEKQLLHLIDRVHMVEVDESTIAPYMVTIEEKLAALSRDELLKHFVSLQFNHFLDYYKSARDLTSVKQEKSKSGKNKTSKKNTDRRKSEYDWPENAWEGFDHGWRGKEKSGRENKTGNRNNFITLTINLGWKDRILPQDIIYLVNHHVKGGKVPLGKINIEKTTTSFPIDKKAAAEVVEKLGKIRLKGKTVKINLDKF